MKKVLLSVILMMAIMAGLQAQNNDSTISMMGKKIYQNGQTLSNARLKSILLSNPASVKDYKSYQVNKNIGTPLVYIGLAGVLGGAILHLSSTVDQADAVNNGDIDAKKDYTGAYLLIGGLGLELISIPFLVSANKKFKKSLFNYNSSFGKTSAIPVQFNMMVNANGLGVRMQF